MLDFNAGLKGLLVQIMQQTGDTMFQRILAILMLLGMLGAITGCNTIEGMGKDISRGGEATQETARDAKKSM